MEEKGNAIRAWAKRGTVKQFHMDLKAKVGPHGKPQI